MWVTFLSQVLSNLHMNISTILKSTEEKSSHVTDSDVFNKCLFRWIPEGSAELEANETKLEKCQNVHGKTSHREAFVPRFPCATVTGNIRISFTTTELMANDCLNMWSELHHVFGFKSLLKSVLFLCSAGACAGWCLRTTALFLSCCLFGHSFKGSCGLDSVQLQKQSTAAQKHEY